MKAIKIPAFGGIYSEKNMADIEAALINVNGKAIAHTYTIQGEIMNVAERAEQKLAELGIPKKDRRGAVVNAISGEKVPNAYKYARIATAVRLERKSGDWFLAAVAATEVREHGGSERLKLTEAQDAIAVSKLRAGYSIQPKIAAVA